MIELQVQVHYTPLGQSSSSGHVQYFTIRGDSTSALEVDLERQKAAIMAGCWDTIRFDPGYHTVGLHNTRADWEAVFGPAKNQWGGFSDEIGEEPYAHRLGRLVREIARGPT